MTLSEIKRDRKYWQRLLRLAGYYHGSIDGILGKLSRAAEAEWDKVVAEAKNEYGCFDERSETNIATLIPQAQWLARKWFILAAGQAFQEGYALRIICGTRSYAEQNALYRKRPRVTRARGGYSWHNFGLAWDFCLFDGREPIWSHRLYDIAGKLSHNIDNLEWGGDWKSFVDKPHLQLKHFTSTSEARKAFES